MKTNAQLKREKQNKDNYFAFYGLPYKDELYFVTKKQRKLFFSKFGYDLFDSYGGDDDDVYDWVSINCRFVAYVACAL